MKTKGLIKTNELIGPALDWAVAKCEGGVNFRFDTVATYWITINGKDRALANKSWAQSFSPSTDWAQGGPIIEREGICTKRQLPASAGYEWNSWQHTKFGNGDASGPTPLIAAMRCYVASKLGDEVEIPEGL